MKFTLARVTLPLLAALVPAVLAAPVANLTTRALPTPYAAPHGFDHWANIPPKPLDTHVPPPTNTYGNTYPQEISRLSFQLTAEEFMDARSRRLLPDADWDSVGCDLNPVGFNFEAACRRREFALRNFKKLGLLDYVEGPSIYADRLKPHIEQKFKGGMYAQCLVHDQPKVCRSVADLYYMTIEKFGVDTAYVVLKGDGRVQGQIAKVTPNHEVWADNFVADKEGGTYEGLRHLPHNTHKHPFLYEKLRIEDFGPNGSPPPAQ